MFIDKLSGILLLIAGAMGVVNAVAIGRIDFIMLSFLVIWFGVRNLFESVDF